MVRWIVEISFLELLETGNRKRCLLEASSVVLNNRILSQRIDWLLHRFGYPFCNEMKVQSRGRPSSRHETVDAAPQISLEIYRVLSLTDQTSEINT
jgi:hypothetical protein